MAGGVQVVAPSLVYLRERLWVIGLGRRVLIHILAIILGVLIHELAIIIILFR
jgi:hypothetical protein